MGTFAAVAFHPRVWRRWELHVPWLGRRWYQAGWAVAAGTHLYKGVRAQHRAEAAGLPDARAWRNQTFILGWPSDRLLVAVLRRRSAR
jgi:hypothetical protein